MNSTGAQIVLDDIYADYYKNIKEGITHYAFQTAIIRFIHLYLKIWINKNV